MCPVGRREIGRQKGLLLGRQTVETVPRGQEGRSSSVEPMLGTVIVWAMQSECLFKVLRTVLRKCSATQHKGKEGEPSSFADSPSIGLSIEVPWNDEEYQWNISMWFGVWKKYDTIDNEGSCCAQKPGI